MTITVLKRTIYYLLYVERCNLQIKNDKSVPIYFFNGMKYDNSILLKSLCDIYNDEITLNCIG